MISFSREAHEARLAADDALARMQWRAVERDAEERALRLQEQRLRIEVLELVKAKLTDLDKPTLREVLTQALGLIDGDAR